MPDRFFISSLKIPVNRTAENLNYSHCEFSHTVPKIRHDSSYCVIVWVRVVLKRTVVGD